jgi:Tfp pilus assembly protein PilO
VSALWERALAYFGGRSQREQWLVIIAAVVVIVMLVHGSLVQPMRAEIGRRDVEIERLQSQLLRATRMAADVRRLQGELAAVEERIEPGTKTNLFTLLESLANQAAVKDQLESIKPKQASGNDRYPETRVEVQLKGATLAQTVNYLYRIETAPMHLIIRSIRIKARGGEEKVLDVSFSVSSFERRSS